MIGLPPSGPGGPGLPMRPPSSPPPGGGGAPGAPDNAAAAALKMVEHGLLLYITAETDPAEKAVGTKLLAEVHKLDATKQAEKDAATGITPALKHARRVQNGGAPISAGPGY